MTLLTITITEEFVNARAIYSGTVIDTRSSCLRNIKQSRSKLMCFLTVCCHYLLKGSIMRIYSTNLKAKGSKLVGRFYALNLYLLDLLIESLVEKLTKLV